MGPCAKTVLGCEISERGEWERRFEGDGAASVCPSVIAQNTNFLHGASAPLSSSCDACACVSLSLYLGQKRRYNSGSESGPQARDGRRRKEGRRGRRSCTMGALTTTEGREGRKKK